MWIGGKCLHDGDQQLLLMRMESTSQPAALTTDCE